MLFRFTLGLSSWRSVVMTCQPLSDSLHTAQFTQSSAKPAAEDEQLLNCQVGTTPVAADAFEITSITMSAASFSSPVPNNNIFFNQIYKCVYRNHQPFRSLKCLEREIKCNCLRTRRNIWQLMGRACYVGVPVSAILLGRWWKI